MRIESIQVGQPKSIAKDWTTAIYKTPVRGPLFLGETNLEGDGQADLSVHGGIDKAVNVYPLEHYAYWSQRCGFFLTRRLDLPVSANGSFGENFTVSGLHEDRVFIGDTFAVGEAVVQVSQPRQPCWKLARRFKQPKLPAWVQKTGRTGWYFRVLKTGMVSPENTLTLVERGDSYWTLSRANQIMHAREKSIADVKSILNCRQLSSSWRKTFQDYMQRHQ